MYTVIDCDNTNADLSGGKVKRVLESAMDINKMANYSLTPGMQ